MSPTMWPLANWSASLFLIAWMTTTASPPNITSWRPISIANWTARLQASVSTVAIDWGSGIRIESAPMTATTLSHMTTPKPAASIEENKAPSKLALYRVCIEGHSNEAKLKLKVSLRLHLGHRGSRATSHQLQITLGSVGQLSGQGESHFVCSRAIKMWLQKTPPHSCP